MLIGRGPVQKCILSSQKVSMTKVLPCFVTEGNARGVTHRRDNTTNTQLIAGHVTDTRNTRIIYLLNVFRPCGPHLIDIETVAALVKLTKTF